MSWSGGRSTTCWRRRGTLTAGSPTSPRGRCRRPLLPMSSTSGTPKGRLRRSGEGRRLQESPDQADDLQVQETATLTDLDTSATGEAVEVVPDAIVVRLGVARYAVPMADVAEVVPVPRVTRVPGMPPWLAGVVNWRGHLPPLPLPRPPGAPGPRHAALARRCRELAGPRAAAP